MKNAPKPDNFDADNEHTNKPHERQQPKGPEMVKDMSSLHAEPREVIHAANLKPVAFTVAYLTTRGL